MIDLPIGKALVAYEAHKKCGLKCETDKENECRLNMCCDGCEMKEIEGEIRGGCEGDVCEFLCCFGNTRKDGKEVFYKIVDYPFK
jgi:hypothetical protein